MVVTVCWIAVCLSLSSARAQHDAPFPLSPEEAARQAVVPPGFQVTLFAGEPDVKQPIGFCIDDRGRLWVAEAYNYPVHGTRAGDRILILDDEDGDGRFDKRTVFYDQLNYVTGIEVGFGGAWVMSPPFFYFIPDADGDDRPDSEPRVLLDGFGNHANAHNLANGFAWGPDGWLYGTHGRTNWSLLGKPGTPDDQRIRFDGGVYRYHPTRHVWEPYADGTTNPWGIDWDDYGQAFVCNCVNPHLFHVIPGAHYEPWRNRESSRYAYQRIDTIADHLHFVDDVEIRAGIGSPEEDAAGGGHAHCGTMVYLGDSWPRRYRNTIFMNNIHGRRINNDLPRRSGSGYVASHGPDFLRSRDPWFMGVTLAYGPDGGVYASDWSDTGECHSVRDTRRHTGRIFKITYGPSTGTPVDLSQKTDEELVELQLHPNDWFVRHARRLLQERFAAGRDMTGVKRRLLEIYSGQDDVTRKLRALWALYVIDALDDRFLIQQLDDSSEHVRAWAVRLLCEDGNPPDDATRKFRLLAAEGPSPLVRLHLASALQRLPPARRWELATALSSRSEDAADQNLPLMIWYAIEPLYDEDPARFVALATDAEIPLVRRHVARRVASDARSPRGLEDLARAIGQLDRPVAQGDIVEGMLRGLTGRRRVEMPESWPIAYKKLKQNPSDAVRRQATRLALVFDDPAALELLRRVATDSTESVDSRNEAIEALVARKPDDLAPTLLTLLTDERIRASAVRGLVEFDDPRIVDEILRHYDSFDAACRQDALATLASRPDWAMSLLDAVRDRRIDASDLSAYTARQLRNLDDPRVVERVQSLWGQLRATPSEKARLIAAHKRRLSEDSLRRADRSAGRALFEKNCANCHRLFGNGGDVGPDITGSQRRNLDYLLENLIDPSAAVSRDYQVEILETAGGRSITGLVVEETDSAVTIRTEKQRVVVPLDEIERRTASAVSMMPDGLLQQLSPRQVRDLVAYLTGTEQAPPPKD